MLSTARAIAEAIQSRATSAEAIMTEALGRIRSYDEVQPQAWIARFDDEVLLEAARAIDARVAAGEGLPLAGVPYAVKDNIDVAGLPTTAGCPAFAYDPPRSAHVVARLEAAGAICVGKTNLDQFATGLVGTRSPYGIPACVYNRDYVSGGSSSGSGVVVAAGLVPFALGTDTAGSGRVPAAFNGCIGFKPTKGRWSTSGLSPACRSLDCISVFTTDPADAALIDSRVAGFDAGDPFSRHAAASSAGGGGLPLGVPLSKQLEFFGDKESAALFGAALDRCRALGFDVVEVDISPLMDAARLLYTGPWLAERTAAVGAFIEEKADAVHPVVGSIIRGGRKVTGVATFEGIYALQQYARDAQSIWDQVLALVLPTTPTIYRIEDVLAEPFGLNSRIGHYTASINLLDLCAIALPAGYRENSTGFGISLIGPAFADARLLDLGRHYMDDIAMTPPPLDMTVRDKRIALAVVGAHLEGMPLHWQLTSRDARFLAKARTAPAYKLYAIANSVPAKPALVHVGADGVAIEVEIYDLSVEGFGSFVAEVPAPLAIGTITLESGEEVKGFVSEPRAIEGAADISDCGGWRNFLARTA